MTTKEEVKENEVIHAKLNMGVKFTIPDWSYGKHKRVFKRLSAWEQSQDKPVSTDDKNRHLETFIIIESLTEAGVEISEEILDTLHPNDRLELYFYGLQKRAYTSKFLQKRLQEKGHS